MSQATEATVHDLELESPALRDAQTQSPSAIGDSGIDKVARLVLLASMGLITIGQEASITTFGLSESTYVAAGRVGVENILVDALKSIHDTLLRDAVELDPRAREILSNSLWDLYAS